MSHRAKPTVANLSANIAALSGQLHIEDKTTTLIQGTGSNNKWNAVIINESGVLHVFALCHCAKLKIKIETDGINRTIHPHSSEKDWRA